LVRHPIAISVVTDSVAIKIATGRRTKN